MPENGLVPHAVAEPLSVMIRLDANAEACEPASALGKRASGLARREASRCTTYAMHRLNWHFWPEVRPLVPRNAAAAPASE
jgi:hypothetical protein